MNNHFFSIINISACKENWCNGKKRGFQRENYRDGGGGEGLWILMVFFKVYIPPGFREDNMLLVIELLDNLFSLIL